MERLGQDTQGWLPGLRGQREVNPGFSSRGPSPFRTPPPMRPGAGASAFPVRRAQRGQGAHLRSLEAQLRRQVLAKEQRVGEGAPGLAQATVGATYLWHQHNFPKPSNGRRRISEWKSRMYSGKH